MEYKKILCPRKLCKDPKRGWTLTKKFDNELREYRCHGCGKFFYYNARLRRMYRWHKKYSSLKYMVVADEFNDEVVECLVHLESKSTGRGSFRGVARIGSPEECDIFIVLGGDGTMLRAVHDYAKFQKPFMGFNFGVRGFLLNSASELSFQALAYEDYEIFTAPLLEVIVRTADGRVFSGLALNDVSVSRGDRPQSAWLEIAVDDVLLRDRLIGDGVIVSTPIGCTGYAINENGSVILPSISAFEITPNGVSPKYRIPLVVSDSSLIKVRVLQLPKRRVSVTYDSNVFDSADIQEVEIRRANLGAHLAFFKPLDMLWDEFFLSRIREKVYQD